MPCTAWTPQLSRRAALRSRNASANSQEPLGGTSAHCGIANDSHARLEPPAACRSKRAIPVHSATAPAQDTEQLINEIRRHVRAAAKNCSAAAASSPALPRAATSTLESSSVAPHSSSPSVPRTRAASVCRVQAPRGSARSCRRSLLSSTKTVGSPADRPPPPGCGDTCLSGCLPNKGARTLKVAWKPVRSRRWPFFCLSLASTRSIAVCFFLSKRYRILDGCTWSLAHSTRAAIGPGCPVQAAEWKAEFFHCPSRKNGSTSCSQGLSFGAVCGLWNLSRYRTHSEKPLSQHWCRRVPVGHKLSLAIVWKNFGFCVSPVSK
mmetsp:Transcript_2062/g.6081  ORF Transcript_2062/g.6081 Transcript_2062/m.6081 type:complete len:321 (-) Transcript_2062:516-1478(-)